MSTKYSVGACVADTNARGQLMLIFGTMHNFEEYAIVIQKNDGAIFSINFYTILTRFNSNREMPNCPLDTFV